MSTDDEPPITPDKDGDRAEKQRRYRQQYWERFRETHKRVYGTLTIEEYEAFQERAESAGRAVWAQIQAEAEAYARQEYLPPPEVEARITELIVQLRRLGNNVNQIAHTLHADGTLRASDLARSFDELEQVIHHFVKQPWAKGAGDDDEPPTP